MIFLVRTILNYDQSRLTVFDRSWNLREEIGQSYTFDHTVAADLLGVLANPIRLAILRRITVEEWDVNALAKDLGMSQSALSQHLCKLREAELVETRRSAQQIIYSSGSLAVLSVLSTLSELGLEPCKPTLQARREMAGRKRKMRVDAA
jgi:DNA-binding transcriptional ArsR family regulator